MTDQRPSTGVAYLGNRFPEHFVRDLARIRPVCDHIVHPVSETDLYFHKAALTRIFEASRRAGLEVWADPWSLGGVFGGESLSRFLLDHPGLWQVLSDGRRVPAACINRPAFRDFVKEWVIAVSHLGAQVVFWDEPHVFFHWDLEWEGVYACVCPACSALFKKKHGVSPPATLNDDARAFRKESLTSFLNEMMEYAHHKKMKNALCLYAFEGYAPYDALWAELAAMAPLDVFGCDPYWRWRPAPQDPDARVRHYTEKTVASVPPGKGAQVWLQAMRLPKGKESEIETACRAAAAAGATHITAWSYDGGALLDTVLSEDPAAVWAAVERAFSALRAGGS